MPDRLESPRDRGLGRALPPNETSPESRCTRNPASRLPLFVTNRAAIASDPDPSSFEQLVRDHQTMVWRYLRFLGCTDDDARDLTQDTFLAVIDKTVHRFGDAGARAYLRKVARNAFVRFLQRTSRQPRVDLDIAEAAYEWYRGDDEGETMRDALVNCLDTLSAQARRALELRFVDRFTRGAIAAELGLGEHGAKSLLQRSYARLRACIERRLRHEPA